RKRGDLIAHADLACLDLSLESTEGTVRTAHALYRHGKSCLRRILMDVDVLQISKKRLALVPRHVAGFYGDVVAFCGGDRKNLDGVVIVLSHHHLDLFLDLVKAVLVVMDEVHLVY